MAGETIVLGDLGAEGDFAMHMHDDAHAIDIDIDTDVMIEGARQIRIVKTGDADNVTVISGGAHKEVHIIRKEVDVTN